MRFIEVTTLFNDVLNGEALGEGTEQAAEIFNKHADLEEKAVEFY